MFPSVDRYLSFNEISTFLHSLAARDPENVRLDVIGHSANGLPLWLLTLGTLDGREGQRPGFWIDGGTHCAEWAGVSACLHAAANWMQAHTQGQLRPSLDEHTLYILPCMAPDGYVAMFEGAPYIRSTLRPPPEGTVRTGWSPVDMDGDGVVRLVRWRHPAGPFVVDEQCPLHMRARTLSDDPTQAYFVAEEGQFLNWDGQRWTMAPREFGLDLNRNFPGNWAPASMFGMDAGTFPGSAPEARAVLDAFAARPNIGAVITNHTFSGVLLTAPYRADSELTESDLLLMQALAKDAVEGTTYSAVPVQPDFAYDPKSPIRGVWADSLATVFGLPGYTLEIWDPFAAASTRPAHRGRFFREPEPHVLRALVQHFSKEPTSLAWTPFEHPQLGAVEVGGLDLQRTVRNPPEHQLAQELDQVFVILDRARRSIPQIQVRAHRNPLAGAGTDHTISEITVCVENLGFLPTNGLDRASTIGRTPGIRLELCAENAQSRVVDPQTVRDLGHLDGWGTARVGAASLPLLPALSPRGHRAVARFMVEGPGPFRLRYTAARAGSGEIVIG